MTVQIHTVVLWVTVVTSYFLAGGILKSEARSHLYCNRLADTIQQNKCPAMPLPHHVHSWLVCQLC